MTESLSLDERFKDIEYNISRVRENIAIAAEKSGRRASDIRLMAVTKTVEPVLINHALKCGIDLIGENKVPELLSKLDYLHPSDVEKHLIGHLQTNKVAKVLPHVSMIESVDSVHLAKSISDRARILNTRVHVLVEVNIAAEESKTGLPYELLDETVDEISEMGNIQIDGLMCVPPFSTDSVQNCKYFELIYKLYIDIGLKKLDNVNMSVLSMGMSGDYSDAISMGSNLVRIGSAVFGARRY